MGLHCPIPPYPVHSNDHPDMSRNSKQSLGAVSHMQVQNPQATSAAFVRSSADNATMVPHIPCPNAA